MLSATKEKKRTGKMPMGKIRRFCYENRYILLAFFVPFILMFIACAAAGMFPFGDNQIAVIDMYHQYYPFIQELHEKLQSGGSLLYSWNGGLGTNFLALTAYYAASPLYLLTIFVPDAYLMEAVTLIILMKIGFAGAFMAIYLRGMFGRCDLATVAFSTLYALCAYVMGYYWCLMWLDVVALLPLCILGLNRLIDRGDFRLYTLTLAVMMFTNYYIGGMACIFIFFYFPVLYFSRTAKRGTGFCLRTTGKAVLCSVTGILMAGFLLLPTFLQLQSTYYIDSEMPQDSVFYEPLLDVLTNLLPDTELTVREGLPNIYCGLLTVMLTVCFLLCRRIPLRKKLLNSALLGFLFLSLNWNKLDFLWHGMHFPNQLPYRYSFVVSFLLITLAYEAFLHIRELSAGRLSGVAAAGMVYILLAQKLYEGEFQETFVYVCLAFLFLYSGLLALYRRGRLKPVLLGVALLLVTAGEMMNNTALAVETVSYTDRAEYFAESEDVRTLAGKMWKQDKGFFRMEVTNPLILNAPMLYSCPGVSEFSSTVNGKVSYLMEHLGLEAENAKNRYNYVPTTPVINAMLGVKYLVSRGQPLTGEDLLMLTGGENMTTLYQNPYCLSAGYMADAAVMRDWDYEQADPFVVQNDFVDMATGEDFSLFDPLGIPEVTGEAVELGQWDDGVISCAGSDRQPEETASAQVTFTAPAEQQVYVFVETGGAESITATADNGNSVSLREDCGAAVSVGKCAEGDEITIEILYEDEQEPDDITVYAYGLDEAEWNRAYALLADETLRTANWEDTAISGSIRAKADGYLITSIPAEKGWKLEVDGEKVKTEAFGEALLAAPLTAGEHEIRLTYLPDGLLPGFLLTLIGIGIFIVLWLQSRLMRSRPVQGKLMQSRPMQGRPICTGQSQPVFPARSPARSGSKSISGEQAALNQQNTLHRRRFL